VKKNPFHKPLVEFFENVAQISHIASVSEKLFATQIDQAKKVIANQSSSKKASSSSGDID